MPITRRTLLGFGGVSALLILPVGYAHPANGLRTSIVRDDMAAPRLCAGQTLLVDADSTSFAGDGLYLYPAWGQPRPYLVTAGQRDLLQFRNPGTGHVLWEQTAGSEGGFAARVLGLGDETLAAGGFSTSLAGGAPLLQVPQLPA